MRNLKITRGNYEYELSKRSDWLDDFADKLAAEKPQTAVDQARIRNSQSLMDQINSIMGNSGQFYTVESKVKDLQQRVGLSEYFKRIQASQSKEAQVVPGLVLHNLPQIFSKWNKTLQDQVDAFLKNKVKTHLGNISLPALIEDVIHMFPAVDSKDLNDPELAKYISDLIVQEKSQHPTFDSNELNLGKGVGVNEEKDEANTDFLRGLMPTNK